MREIKFRAWIAEYRCFDSTVAANLLLQLHEKRVDIDPEYGTQFFLQQYTGLKDKSGVDVYEGDILKADDNSASVVIEFRGGQFVGINTDKEASITETQNRNWFNWVVIGNIYQTPELLK